MATEYLRRTDSDGKTHYIDKQDEPMSCALACIGMVWDQTRSQCSVLGESGYKAVSGTFPGSLLASQTGGGIGSGTDFTNVTTTLATVGVVVRATYGLASPLLPPYNFTWQKNRIGTRHPALVLVGWYRGAGAAMTRPAGHYVVAPRVTSKGWVVILDPFTGTLHELHGSRGQYNNHGSRGFIEYIWYTG